METLKLRHLLKGVRPYQEDGKTVVQTIGNMSIVCLITDNENSFDYFGNPNDIKFRTQDYGHAVVKNDSSKPIIVPPQATFIGAKRAQDHAFMTSKFVDVHSEVNVEDAGCIQSNQGGMYSYNDSVATSILPFQLREVAMENNGSSSYNKLWPAIKSFNSEMDIDESRSHLHDYYDKYSSELKEFIVHFERPNNLIGVIVFIDNEIVAIDKFPSFEYAEQIWDSLVRDCYGSLAIQSRMKNRSYNISFTEEYNKLNVRSIDAIEQALDQVYQSMNDVVSEKWSQIDSINFKETNSDDSGSCRIGNYEGSLKISTVEADVENTSAYIGQVISHENLNDEDNLYYLVNVIKRSAFDPKQLHKIQQLRSLSRSQIEFQGL